MRWDVIISRRISIKAGIKLTERRLHAGRERGDEIVHLQDGEDRGECMQRVLFHRGYLMRV